MKYGETTAAVLEAITENPGRLTTGKIAELLERTPSTISYQLTKLLNTKKIERIGWTYRPADKAVEEFLDNLGVKEEKTETPKAKKTYRITIEVTVEDDST